MTGAIVGAVLFWVLKELVAVVIVILSVLLFGGIGSAMGAQEAGIGLGVVVGWVGAVVWTIFALVQTVLQIVSIVQMAAG